MKQSSITVHLAIIYLDIILQDELIFDKIKSDSLSLTCLLLGSKFDELDDNIPLIREFQRAYYKQRDIPYEEVIKCELEVLRILDWDLFKLSHLHIV